MSKAFLLGLFCKGEQVPLFGGVKSPLGRGERWPWVTSEEPIQDGEGTGAGCFCHDLSAAGNVGLTERQSLSPGAGGCQLPVLLLLPCPLATPLPAAHF